MAFSVIPSKYEKLSERSLFFSGIMIALCDNNFRNTYKQSQKPMQGLEAENINIAILNAVDEQLSTKVNSLCKKINWRDRFSFIKTIDLPLDSYKEIISDIETKANECIAML